MPQGNNLQNNNIANNSSNPSLQNKPGQPLGNVPNQQPVSPAVQQQPSQPRPQVLNQNNTTNQNLGAQDQYINPHNFQKVLGVEPQQNIPKPPVQNPQPQQQPLPKAPVQQQNNLPNQQLQTDYVNQVKAASIPPMQTNSYMEKKLVDQKEVNRVEGKETLKLVVYAVPIIGIFVLVLKSVTNREVMWHVRQSLVGQGIWFITLIVLRLLDLPIISDQGATLWNIACYALLIIAGVKAYNNERYHIPVAYDAGKNFIEGE